MLLCRNSAHRFSKALQLFPQKPRKMSTLREKLMCPVGKYPPASSCKITVVGVGQVGMACTMALLTQRVSADICMIDIFKEKLEGEMLDLQHGSMFLQNARISATADYSCAAGSSIVAITSGARQSVGESRLNLVQRNVDILKDIIPKLMKFCPNAIILMVANPVDILTYVAWKLSGLPVNRVIGSGTNLDSARFRFLLSQRLGLAPNACHGWIIGEHGGSAVPVWSAANVGGVRLHDINPKVGGDDDAENWKEVFHKVKSAANEIIKLKGHTSWAIGLSVAALCNDILRNSNNVSPISTMIKGYHGIEKEVFLSLPCSLSRNGVTNILKQKLSEAEREQLCKSANIVSEVQAGIKL